jgi:large subunit ribosomal protein L24
MLARIKKNDMVQVISGKDAGKRGAVLQVNKIDNTVLVQGINIITKHVKARKQDQKSEIKRIEALINASNVMLVCPSCQKPCRINSGLVEGAEKRVRICNRCKQAI